MPFHDNINSNKKYQTIVLATNTVINKLYKFTTLKKLDNLSQPDLIIQLKSTFIIYLTLVWMFNYIRLFKH